MSRQVRRNRAPGQRGRLGPRAVGEYAGGREGCYDRRDGMSPSPQVADVRRRAARYRRCTTSCGAWRGHVGLGRRHTLLDTASLVHEGLPAHAARKGRHGEDREPIPAYAATTMAHSGWIDFVRRRAPTAAAAASKHVTARHPSAAELGALSDEILEVTRALQTMRQGRTRGWVGASDALLRRRSDAEIAGRARPERRTERRALGTEPHGCGRDAAGR